MQRFSSDILNMRTTNLHLEIDTIFWRRIKTGNLMVNASIFSANVHIKIEWIFIISNKYVEMNCNDNYWRESFMEMVRSILSLLAVSYFMGCIIIIIYAKSEFWCHLSFWLPLPLNKHSIPLYALLDFQLSFNHTSKYV